MSSQVIEDTQNRLTPVRFGGFIPRKVPNTVHGKLSVYTESLEAD
jgi:hypothetical protein